MTNHIFDKSITIDLDISLAIDYYNKFFNTFIHDEDDILDISIYYIFYIISNEIDKKELSKLLLLSEEGEAFILCPSKENMKKMFIDSGMIHIIDFRYKLSSTRYQYPTYHEGIEYDLVSTYRNKE